MDKHSRKMWERRTDETDKAYNAFLEYIKMPIQDLHNPENARTLVNLTKKLGYGASPGKAASTLEKWSSKYNWQERTAAYDTSKAELSIEVRDGKLAEYQSHVIEESTLQVQLASQLISRELMEKLQNQQAGIPLKSTDISRLVNAMKTVDDLRRRIAGMPTTYTSEVAEDTTDEETTTYIIGGG